ncbi:MAG: phosphotyrosine protein phosphatase [Butyrivibrio sp.]
MYHKLIFVCMDNSCRSPVAEAIMKQINRVPDLEIMSKGIIVLFPEPYNPKARAVLLSNNIIMENGTSLPLEEKDFSEDTLILTMDRNEKQKILEEFENPVNVYTLMEFAGGSGDIFDPYGGDPDVYALFLESIKTWVTQAEERLYNDSISEKEQTKEEEQ